MTEPAFDIIAYQNKEIEERAKDRRRVWVDVIGMPEDDYGYVVMFINECRLQGYSVAECLPPVYRYSRPMLVEHRVMSNMARFCVGGEREDGLVRCSVSLGYNWHAKVRPWRVKTDHQTASTYKTVENAINFIRKLLRDYERCGI